MYGEFILLGVIIFCVILAWLAERKGYNGGTCPHCQIRLVHFDNDSQGGRGYTCRSCDYTTWVSWFFIDTNHDKELQKSRTR